MLGLIEKNKNDNTIKKLDRLFNIRSYSGLKKAK